MAQQPSVNHHRTPAPSGQCPRRRLRSDPTLTVDSPRDAEHRAFLLSVAERLSDLEPPVVARRSYQPTLCNYWHDTSRFGVCWKCSQVTRAFCTPAITPTSPSYITPPVWSGVYRDTPDPELVPLIPDLEQHV